MKHKNLAVYLITFVCLLQSFISCLNFYNTHVILSYANYPPWLETSDGKATLEFKFKAKKPYGLLLTCDDGDSNQNLFQLKLDNGALHAHFKMGSEEYLSIKQANIGSMWNDMEWHRVKVTRNFRDITIRIDDHEKTLTSDGEADRIVLTSLLRIGGDPSNGSEEGFTGCIKDLAYPVGRERDYPISRYGEVNSLCLDRCTDHDHFRSRCENKGQCVKVFQEEKTECDCTATGATGATCSRKEPIVFLNKGTVISRSNVESLRFFRVNKIEFRFRTNYASGIILYGSDATNYVLIELVNGMINAKISLGTGILTLTAGNGLLHDGAWHSVVLKRYGQQAFVTIDADRFINVNSFQHYPAKSCFEEKFKMFVGGYKTAHLLAVSESKENFEGCLQQVHFHEGDSSIIDLIKRSIPLEYTRIHGNLSTKCHVKRIEIHAQSTPAIIQRPLPDTTAPVTTLPLDKIAAQQKPTNPRNKLSQSTVAWITGGICVGSIAMILTLACGFHLIRKRYSGKFLADSKFRKSTYGTTTSMQIVDDGYSIQSSKHAKPAVV